MKNLICVLSVSILMGSCGIAVPKKVATGLFPGVSVEGKNLSQLKILRTKKGVLSGANYVVIQDQKRIGIIENGGELVWKSKVGETHLEVYQVSEASCMVFPYRDEGCFKDQENTYSLTGSVEAEIKINLRESKSYELHFDPALIGRGKLKIKSEKLFK